MGWDIRRVGPDRRWVIGWFKDLKLSRTWRIIIPAAIILAIVLLFFTTRGSERDQYIKNQLVTALDSMAQTDESQWQALIHPKYGEHLLDLDTLKNQLRKNNIAIGQDWNSNGEIDCSEENYRGCNAVRITCRIRTGFAKEYEISALYIVDEPEGFVEFNVYAV